MNVVQDLPPHLAGDLDECCCMHEANTHSNSNSNIGLETPFPKSCYSAFYGFEFCCNNSNSSGQCCGVVG